MDQPDATKSAWDTSAEKQEPSPAETEDKPTTFKDLAEETTLHGISKAVNSRYSWIRRIFWVLVLLLMLALLIKVLTTGIITYFEYPSNTKISVIPKANLTPAAVTLCNNNKVNSWKMWQWYGNDNRTYTWLNTIQPTLYHFPDVSEVDPEAIEWANSTDGVTFFRRTMSTIDDMLQWCTFNGMGVPCTDVTDIVYTQDGYCYRVSSRQFPEEMVTRPGARFGLSFQVNIYEEAYYTFASSPGVGAQVMIHDTPQFPSESRLFNAAPGTEIHVALTKSESKRLGKPWSDEDCRDNMTVPDYRFSSTYTRDGCLMECFMKHINNNCGCDLFGDHATLPNCTLLQFYVCRKAAYESAILNNMLSETESCGCIRSCHDVTYNTDVSAMNYPSGYVGEYVKGVWGVDREYIKQNIFRMYVYFKSMEVEIVEQQKSYTLNQFAADVGGQMGLFLGASIITVSEFVEFVMVFFIERCKKRKKTKVGTSSTKLQIF